MGDARPGRSLLAPVAVLCAVRLAALSLATVVLVSQGGRGPELLVLLAALPLSYWPLRRAARGQRASVGAAFAIVDVVGVLAVLVVAGLDSLAVGYVGASLVLAALWRGAGAAWGLCGALVALHVGALLAGAADSPAHVAAVAARLLLFLAVAVAGVRLRALLLSREHLDDALQADRVRAASEAERSRLARDMHDSLSKTLHGTHLLASVLHDRLRREGSAIAGELAVLVDAVDSARLDARRLLGELRREPVDDLAGFLRDLGTDWSERTGVPLVLDLPDTDPPLAADAREELARAAGELLENVARHACAEQAELSLHTVDGAVELSVRDDGVGLASDDLTALYRAGHFGLIGVRERMARAGGTLELRPAPGSGTEAVLTCPLDGSAPSSLPADGPLRLSGVVPQHPHSATARVLTVRNSGEVA